MGGKRGSLTLSGAFCGDFSAVCFDERLSYGQTEAESPHF